MSSSLAFLVKSSFQEQPEGHPLSLGFSYSFSHSRINYSYIFSFPQLFKLTSKTVLCSLVPFSLPQMYMSLLDFKLFDGKINVLFTLETPISPMFWIQSMIRISYHYQRTTHHHLPGTPWRLRRCLCVGEKKSVINSVSEHNTKHSYYFYAIKTVNFSLCHKINKTLERKCRENQRGGGQWPMEKLKNLVSTITTLSDKY